MYRQRDSARPTQTTGGICVERCSYDWMSMLSLGRMPITMTYNCCRLGLGAVEFKSGQ
jgi:hypothetical protein